MSDGGSPRVIYMSPQGVPHGNVIEALTELLVPPLVGRARVRVQLPFVIDDAVNACTIWLQEGAIAAMNKINASPAKAAVESKGSAGRSWRTRSRVRTPPA